MSEAAAAPATYEEIIDLLLPVLHRRGILSDPPGPTSWEEFARLARLVHDHYEVPSTTITPVMAHLLFALGRAARPNVLVGVGTYVSYAFSWLLGVRDEAAGASWQRATGFDVDAGANMLARRNCGALGHGGRLAFVDGDGIAGLAGGTDAIDLLYLDLDDPATGKAGYLQALAAALPRLRAGAVVLAHDPCVPRFAADFAAYHTFLCAAGRFTEPLVLPVDACGLSVAGFR